MSADKYRNLKIGATVLVFVGIIATVLYFVLRPKTSSPSSTSPTPSSSSTRSTPSPLYPFSTPTPPNVFGDVRYNPDGTSVVVGPAANMPSYPASGMKLRTIGMPCVSPWDCQSMYCEHTTCKAPTTAPPPVDTSKKTVGQTCEQNSECQTDLCMKCGSGCIYDKTCQTMEILQEYGRSLVR